MTSNTLLNSLLICSLLAPLAGASTGLHTAGMRILEQTPGHTTIEVQPQSPVISVDKDGLASIELDGYTLYASHGEYMLPSHTEFWEVPPTGRISVVVEELRTRLLPDLRPALGVEDAAGEVRPGSAAAAGVDADQPYRGQFTDFVHLGDPVILRDLRICPLGVQPFVVRAEGLEVLEHAVIRLSYGSEGLGGNELGAAHSWSSSMEQIYDGLVPNHGQFYDSVDDTVFPVYCITGADAYLNMSVIGEFVSWKRRKGFDVRLVPFSTIGSENPNTCSYPELKAWADAIWDSDRPEVMLLIGDEDETLACPTSFVVSVEGDHDVTDHDLTLQEGDDYLPEFLVGRMSVDNVQQLVTVARKPVVHESQTPVDDSECDWHKRGLVVSCNYADNGQAPISPNLTSRWLIDKMRANGFCMTPADSVFYPPISDGGTPIGGALNSGRGIVSYRGWANSNGWVFPAFDRDDISALSNGYRMPIVASFVCQTGAFGGEETVLDPCFGERFLQFGNLQTLGGAVAFVGPSDLHTRTQFNNPVCSGFFNAIFDLDLTSVGSALLNGKLELYRGYPLTRDDPYEAFFYFHVYNVLGDPDLKIWRNQPRVMSHDAPPSIAAGVQTMDLHVIGQDGEPLENAVVSLVGGSSNSRMVARARSDAQGRVLLQIDTSDLTSMVLTINHIDYTPGGRTISVVANTEGVQYSSAQISEETVDGTYRAGETLSILPSLLNTGSATIANLEATLEENSELFEILDGSASWTALAGGTTAASSDPLQVRLNPDLGDHQQGPLVIRITGDASATAVLNLDTRNKAITVNDVRLGSGLDHLETGALDTLIIDFSCTGLAALSQAHAALSTQSELISLLDEEPQLIGDLALDASSTLRFQVVGGLRLFPGRLVYLTLETTDADGFVQHVRFLLPNGSDVPGNPTGPDMHGYYALESTDFDLQRNPVYNWKELDPAYGGTFGERLYLRDDQTTQISLPFPITYYGQTFNTLSVCSNGWVSMGTTWMSDFSNWNIPSALGPSNMICAWWEDLKPKYTTNGDSLYVPVFTRHDEAAGQFIISWSRTWARYAWENAGQPLQEFQLIFFDNATRPTDTGDNEFLMQYKQVTNVDLNNNYATVGITNFGHNDGIEVTYANLAHGSTSVPGPGRAILFTTVPPEKDQTLSVNVLQPEPQQWLIPGNLSASWDHGLLQAALGATTVTYSVSVLDENFTPLWTTSVTDTGTLDLTEATGSLPEGELLYLRLEADATTPDGAVPVASLQGDIPFHLDLTAPQLTTAVIENGLFLDQLELAVFCSELMGSLQAFGSDGLGENIGELEIIPGEHFIAGGRELYYLQARLSGNLDHLRIVGSDSHGIPVSQDLGLAQAGGAEGELALPALNLQLSWSAAGSTPLRVLELHRLDGAPQALSPFWLQLPDDVRDLQLRLPARGELQLARRVGGSWQRVEQSRSGDELLSRPVEGGVYALLPAAELESLPTAFALHANWPNPFNPETRIQFDLPQRAAVRLTVYNLLGEQVRVLHQGPLAAGSHQRVWDGTGQDGTALASGMYLARLEADGFSATRKMLLVR